MDESERPTLPTRLLIRMRRNRLGLTQLKLAETVGVSTRTVIRWENGGGLPDEKARASLARVLGGAPADYTAVDEALTPDVERLAERLRKANREISDLQAALAAANEMLERYPDLAQRLADLELIIAEFQRDQRARPTP
jgi:transcriptional regulator with XRE-family HTH domain